MPAFYLRVFSVFALLRATSVLLHYLGPSPWGGRLILRPDRFVPDALIIEAGIWMFLAGCAAAFEEILRRILTKSDARESAVKTFRALFLGGCAAFAIFSQVDFEVVRWLGQHMTASYIANFAGARDGHLFTRILSADILFSSLAAVQMLAAPLLSVWLFVRQPKEHSRLNKKKTFALLALTLLALSSPLWLRPSEKRWRRVRPASLGIAQELIERALGHGEPHNPTRARQDLIDLVYGGVLDANVRPENEEYPLFRRNNAGELSPQAFKDQKASEKPDVYFIVFETMRGTNTGFLGDTPEARAAMPHLKQLFEQEALYFPRVHSAGYPSVEGALGMHLGMWPHHSRIVFSSFLHINTLSFPEMLKRAGYESFALLGADPSFSNFTPWFRRFYDQIEFDEKNHHDGPLVDRFLQLVKEKRDSAQPQLFTLWTATTHPPYDVPASSGIKPAGTNEERYLQAMRYADEQIFRVITELKKSPRWHRSLVFILGDHSQPTPWQWQHESEIGQLNPGHTWTSLGILGGPDVAPTPRRDDRAVSHVDLAPTILQAINLKHGNHFFGRSLLSEAPNNGPERPVLAFRYGTLSVESQSTRSIFHIDGGAPLSYRFQPDDLLSYGGLDRGERQTAVPQIDVERYRDMARAWAKLLDDNQVIPAAEATEN